MRKLYRCIWGGVVIAVFWLAGSSVLYAESLYVFYPTSTPPRLLQKELSRVCPDLDVTVFTRYRDLIKQVEASPPIGVLTKMPVAETLEGYQVVLKGNRGGKIQESYILLSLDTPLDVSQISSMTIGVFDILGRKGMAEFLGQYFPSPPKLKRVSKLEDLLPLLTFNMAQGILISEYDVAFFKERSKLNFVETPVPQMLTEILVLTVDSAHVPDALLQCLQTDGKSESMNVLDIEGWEVP